MRTALGEVVLATTVFALASLPSPDLSSTPRAQTQHDVRVVLELYERRNYEAAVAALSAWPDLKSFSKQLSDVAPAWVAGDGPKAADRRRLIVATVALEAARPAMERDIGSQESAAPEGAPIIGWACELLRSSSPPLPAERWWHLAAIALTEKAFDAYMLLGSLPPNIDPRLAARIRQSHGTAVDQLTHAMQRFPDEARFKLASIVTAEVHQPGGAWFWLNRPSGSVQPSIAATAEWLRLADSYLGLTQTDAVKAESSLRAGVIHFRLGHDDAALNLFDRVGSESTDPYLLYLSRFFKGKLLERAGRRTQAEAAYESALDQIPAAESASAALASLYFLRDARTEAFSLIRSALETRPMPADPWRLYWCGDCRLWSFYLARLREDAQ